MITEHTPSTDDVREAYASGLLHDCLYEGDVKKTAVYGSVLHEFDSWLNQVKDEAWNEGLRLTVGGHPPHTAAVLFNCNPYSN